MKIQVAIVGASGYTGAELLRLLAQHPHVEVSGVYAKTRAGEALSRVFPQFVGRMERELLPFDAADGAAVDADRVAETARVAFLALPHGESARAASALYERGLTVIDLSADFRLRDASTYAAWYGTKDHPTHPAPALLAQAVYGLPERYRERLYGARLIAVPGCYPTATILAIAPLLDAQLVSPQGLIVDAKSGVSGAGRSPALAFHMPEAGEGIRAYQVGGKHRHTPEIEQELSLAAKSQLQLLFTPHLVPMSRGILACVYATPAAPNLSATALRATLELAYAKEAFVTVLPKDQLPDTAFVRGSNRAHVAVAFDERTQRVLALSAIDNLVKGASGQAIQCMNCALGLPETAGLESIALFP